MVDCEAIYNNYMQLKVIMQRIISKKMYLFYRIGLSVATHPWNTIICSILLVMCCSVGLLAFHKEKNPLKLWIPQGKFEVLVQMLS